MIALRWLLWPLIAALYVAGWLLAKAWYALTWAVTVVRLGWVEALTESLFDRHNQVALAIAKP